MTLIDFTLSNARRFYSSMENPTGVKGLRGLKTSKLFKWWLVRSREKFQNMQTYSVAKIVCDFLFQNNETFKATACGEVFAISYEVPKHRSFLIKLVEKCLRSRKGVSKHQNLLNGLIGGEVL